MPVKRSEFGAAIVDGSIVVAGGFEAGTQVDAFNLVPGKWRRLADLPRAVHHAGAAALNGKLYLAGGYDIADQTARSSVLVYDPAEDAWSTAADLLSAKGAFRCVAAGGRLFVLGGAAERLNGPAVGAVDCYDPTHDRWETVAELPTPREHLGAAALGGVIYAFGGRANGDESVQFAAAAEALDLASGRWQTLPPLPTPRAGLSAVAAGNAVVAAGGERGEFVFANVEAFEPSAGIWHSLPRLATARHGLAAVTDGAGNLFALGGSTLGGRVQSIAALEVLSLGMLSEQQSNCASIA